MLGVFLTGTPLCPNEVLAGRVVHEVLELPHGSVVLPRSGGLFLSVSFGTLGCCCVLTLQN